MQYTPIKRKYPAPATARGVYAERDELMRLRYKASGFSFLPRQPIHSVLSGRHASRLRGRGLNFEELRGYLRGDDPRHVDWKVTARTGKPHVRVYTEEKDRTVWLLVDQRMNMFFGSRRRMKSVVAAEAAAVAAWRVLAQGDRVGALVFDDREIRVIEPLRSEQRVTRILDCVIEKNHALNARSGIRPNPEMFNQALRRACERVRHDSLVCLVSDAAEPDWSFRPNQLFALSLPFPLVDSSIARSVSRATCSGAIIILRSRSGKSLNESRLKIMTALDPVDAMYR